MNSNFDRFHEILNPANSENFSWLSHVEPKNLPGSPNHGQDDLVLDGFNFQKKKLKYFPNFYPGSKKFLNQKKLKSLYYTN